MGFNERTATGVNLSGDSIQNGVVFEADWVGARCSNFEYFLLPRSFDKLLILTAVSAFNRTRHAFVVVVC